MRKRLAAGLAALVLLGLGVLIGRALVVRETELRLYARVRLAAVRAHLAEAPREYVFLAGDSHAELQSPAQRPCGIELVNGGVSGATASTYADFIETLTFAIRPRAAMLTIGLNDILVKNRPRDDPAAVRFEEAASRIVRRLMATTDRLVVTAIPPIARTPDARFDPLAVADYSQRLRGLCEHLGCRFDDPFAGLRDGTTGFARPGATREGPHLAAYRPVLRALALALCDGTTP